MSSKPKGTSARVASEASRVMRDPKATPQERSAAAAALRETAAKPKK
jgi:hypothetical protein